MAASSLRLDQPAHLPSSLASRGRAMSAIVEMPARKSLRPILTSTSYQSIPQCTRIAKRRSTEVSGASSRSYRRRRSRRKKSALVAKSKSATRTAKLKAERLLPMTNIQPQESRLGGIKIRLIQTAKSFVMLRVLNDIKKELSEQRQAARERLEDSNNNDKASLSQGSEYSEESLDDSEGSIGPIEFEDRQRPVPKCTILHYSPFKAVWDWIILLLVLYTAVFTPYIVAFLVNETETLMNLNDDQNTRVKNADYVIEDPLVFVDLLVDLMFIADIIINFRTTFVANGEVVSNSKEIAIHYMKGWFVIDAIAAIPFDLLFFGSGTSDTLTATGILKLARLLRLLRVVRRADQYSQYAAATLLLMLISFALIAHWLACVFYVVAYIERKSLPEPVSWLDTLAASMDMPYLANDTTSGPDIHSRYITAMYFTMTTLTSIGFGNVAPNTDSEKIFSIFAMMIGALMSAAIFGNFSSIMMRMYQGSEEMQQKTRSIKDFIKFHTIPVTLSKRMHDAFLHSWSDTNGIDMNSVLKSFPEQIQADICLHLNKNLLNNNVAFKGASPGCLRALSLRFTTTHAPPGDNLIHFGDIVNSVYFIARGSIEILKDNECMAILGRGDIFGISVDDLTSVVKSNYSVHALTFCDMNKIEAYDLQDIFDMYPEFTENFKKKFSLTFNLRMGEYTTLVTPQDMDEETLKLIRQKRPKMQCKGGALNSAAQISFHSGDEAVSMRRDSCRTIERHASIEDLTGAQSTTIELTPAGHGVWSSYDPAPHNRRNSEGKVPKKVTIQSKPVEQKKRSETDNKPTFRSLVLLAAKIQKQKDEEEAAASGASNTPSSPTTLTPRGGKYPTEPITPRAGRHETPPHQPTAVKFYKPEDTQASFADDEERQRLIRISEKIDECMMRATRVEKHWNDNIKTIFKLLGHEPPARDEGGQASQISSYV